MTTRVSSSVLANTAITPGTYGGVRSIPVLKFYANGVAYFAANANIETDGTSSGFELQLQVPETTCFKTQIRTHL